ncbi:efflux RND transporter permease subunit [Selenomonas sp. KH1T6]|uniref:efflux RND transporter permease subunit n=1 Tax=Selenomonas sp. KH1T6 TaxID=3158784 RepID=UPI0008A761A0|nr:multidrug efflux pump [Selenomonas ruminantium]
MRNLSEVSLKNSVLVWYFIIMTAIGGIFAYQQLGRMEDPTFTIRIMVVNALWPGASAAEMQDQVTDKLERKLQDVPGMYRITSSTRPGNTVIYAELEDTMPKEDIRTTWRDLRNLVNDLKSQGELPDGVYGPYFNDRFDDVFGSVYAVTGDGYSYEELRKYAEDARRLLMASDSSIQKIELLGVQKEKIYVEVARDKLASLGLPPTAISDALAGAASMVPSGKVETESDNVYLRVTGNFQDVEAIRELPVKAGGQIFRLGDIAKVERRYSAPPDPEMYFNGEPAVGLAISMKDGSNILELGKNLKKTIKAISGDLPVGLEIHQVSDQPQVVEESIHEFMKTLTEAIFIVLLVSFASLGWRTGLVVACCIPLVLAGVFVGMYLLGIDLHKVSLGALIISLGLLVDDAIIAIEMMSVQLERGHSRFEAACYAFKATAKPMLTGTLITCSGFIPVAFSKGMASEFCGALFPVILIALVLSWIVSVMAAPLFGTYLIRVKVQRDENGEIDPYQNKFYKWFRQVLEYCLLHRKMVLAATAATFVLSLYGLTFVKQEFFPGSLRPELVMEMRLPEGSSMEATGREMERMASFLDEHKDRLENYSYYVGRYAPRFVLTVSPQESSDNFGQFVIVTKNTEEREKLRQELTEELAENFPDVQPNIQTIQTGPPADYPVMLRVTGRTVEEAKELARKTAALVAEDPNVYNVNENWGYKSRVMHLELDQDKLRALGLSSQNVAKMLHTEITGAKAAEFYTGDRTIDIDLRTAEKDRQSLDKLKDLPIYLGQAGYVSLAQIAKISYEGEEGLVKRVDLRPTITVQANIHSGTAVDATKKAFEATAGLREDLPLGASIKPAGSLEDSAKSLRHLVKPIPAMVFIIMTLLMFQLRDIKQMLLTLLTAPLGLIGVAWGMLLTGKAIGFVAYLGILALFGMIIRNSVILIDQIQKHIAEGETPWAALIDSAILRFRPIMLTAAAAILGMMPLMPSDFWGPMAVAIASGLLAATVLTLLVLPAMYAAVYKVEKE